MVDPKLFLQATFEAGRELLRPPREDVLASEDKRPSPIITPIRSLGVNHRSRIAQHLLSLDANDRYLRFGYMAQNEQIQRYVDGLDFDRDDIFGIYNRKLELLAVAHLAYAKAHGYELCAEFGVSVLPAARGRRYGARLFERAAMHASNEGVRMMFIHALSENTAMLKIARNAGARVERDGSETEAYLALPQATLDSRVTEMLEEGLAQSDYSLKVQAKNFWDFLANIQEVRSSAIEAMRRSNS